MKAKEKECIRIANRIARYFDLKIDIIPLLNGESNFKFFVNFLEKHVNIEMLIKKVADDFSARIGYDIGIEINFDEKYLLFSISTDCVKIPKRFNPGSIPGWEQITNN